MIINAIIKRDDIIAPAIAENAKSAALALTNIAISAMCIIRLAVFHIIRHHVVMFIPHQAINGGEEAEICNASLFSGIKRS